MNQSASPKPKLILILGMHRSGTSMVANLLSAMGVYFGRNRDLFEANYGNIFGHFEHTGAIQISREIANLYGGDWIMPPKLPQDWLDQPAIQSVTTQADKILTQLSKKPISAIKVPNLIFNFDLWQKQADKLGIQLDILAIYRNPLEVAHSLNRRNGMDLAEATRYWEAYNKKLLSICKKNPHVLIRYSKLLEEPEKSLALLAEYFSLEISEEILIKSKLIINPSVRHSQVNDEDLQTDDNISESTLKILSQLRKKETKLDSDPLPVITPKQELRILRGFYKDQISELDKLFSKQTKEQLELQEAIKNMDNMIKERDNTIKKLEELFTDKKNEVDNLVKMYKERFDGQEKFIQEKLSTINDIEKLLKERDQTIVDLNNSIAEMRMSEQSLRRKLKEKLQEPIIRTIFRKIKKK